MPITGRAVPQLAPNETAVQSVMRKWGIPGASVAIADQGRLVYARGFGLADRENGIPVQPWSVFRLASISKTIAGMTIVKLVEEGRISLDAKMVDLLPHITPVPGATMDPRVRQITVRHLLHHTGGWDKPVPVDSAFHFNEAARALNVNRATLTPEQMCRYILGQRLDFEPGAKYAYSQAGYLLLGRIIERVTGKKFEEARRKMASVRSGDFVFMSETPCASKCTTLPWRATMLTAPAISPRSI